MKDEPVAMPSKAPHKSRKKKRKRTTFHARSCIPTHDPTFRKTEGLPRLRHSDNCAQQRVETRVMQCRSNIHAIMGTADCQSTSELNQQHSLAPSSLPRKLHSFHYCKR